MMTKSSILNVASRKVSTRRGNQTRLSNRTKIARFSPYQRLASKQAPISPWNRNLRPNLTYHYSPKSAIIWTIGRVYYSTILFCLGIANSSLMIYSVLIAVSHRRLSPHQLPISSNAPFLQFNRQTLYLIRF